MKIRALVVDDSMVIRTLFSKILSSDPEIEVVGTASDAFQARELLVTLHPDVMTLDIEMPKMDGLTFLEKVMEHFPVRTLVISSLSKSGARESLRALEIGAIDILAKPSNEIMQSFEEMSVELITRVKNVARARIAAPAEKREQRRNTTKSSGLPRSQTTKQILAIGASTGGTEALKTILSEMSEDIPGTVIVQHMPPVFTKTFAMSLQKICNFEVREAQDGDEVHAGLVLLAPGNFHMELIRSGTKYHVSLNQKPTLYGVRPAVDHLFNSVAKAAGAHALGLILTGMGRDGAAGLLQMKNAGSYNIAQNEASCVVFGMPKEAIALGAIHTVLSVEKIARSLENHFKQKKVS